MHNYNIGPNWLGSSAAEKNMQLQQIETQVGCYK